MPINLFDAREDDDENIHTDVIEDSDEDESEAFECIEKKHTIFAQKLAHVLPEVFGDPGGSVGFQSRMV